MSPKLREEYEIGSKVEGVVITDVAKGSVAEEKRIRAGDVIVEITQELVESAADVEERIDVLRKDGRKSAVLLLSNQNGDLRFVAVAIEE